MRGGETMSSRLTVRPLVSFFTATFDTRALDRQLQMLSRRDQFDALGRSLRRAQQTMRKVAVAEVQKDLNIKAKQVRDAVEVRRVRSRDTSATVRIVSKGEEIIGFNRTRQVRRGVSVQVKKTGGRKVIAGAFIATLRSGKKSVFRRRFNTATRKRAPRLPIDIVYTTSVRQSLTDKGKQERILAAGRDRFIKEFRREIKRRLGEPV